MAKSRLSLVESGGASAKTRRADARGAGCFRAPPRAPGGDVLLRDGAAAGAVEIVLRNTGLGPALRVRVKATYTGHSDWRPDIAEQVVPVIEAGLESRPQLWLSGPPPGPTGGIRADGFNVSGTYWDRTLRNDYPILVDWLEG